LWLTIPRLSLVKKRHWFWFLLVGLHFWFNHS
jgi:hypothetical protein